jgi:hypothetical protein
MELKADGRRKTVRVTRVSEADSKILTKLTATSNYSLEQRIAMTSHPIRFKRELLHPRLICSLCHMERDADTMSSPVRNTFVCPDHPAAVAAVVCDEQTVVPDGLRSRRLYKIHAVDRDVDSADESTDDSEESTVEPVTETRCACCFQSHPALVPLEWTIDMFPARYEVRGGRHISSLLLGSELVDSVFRSLADAATVTTRVCAACFALYFRCVAPDCSNRVAVSIQHTVAFCTRCSKGRQISCMCTRSCSTCRWLSVDRCIAFSIVERHPVLQFRSFDRETLRGMPFVPPAASAAHIARHLEGKHKLEVAIRRLRGKETTGQSLSAAERAELTKANQDLDKANAYLDKLCDGRRPVAEAELPMTVTHGKRVDAPTSIVERVKGLLTNPTRIPDSILDARLATMTDHERVEFCVRGAVVVGKWARCMSCVEVCVQCRHIITDDIAGSGCQLCGRDYCVHCCPLFLYWSSCIHCFRWTPTNADDYLHRSRPTLEVLKAHDRMHPIPTVAGLTDVIKRDVFTLMIAETTRVYSNMMGDETESD